mgnify:CR=1 FL=1
MGGSARRCKACGSDSQVVMHLGSIPLCRSCRAKVLCGSLPEPGTGKARKRRLPSCSDRPAFFRRWWEGAATIQ